MEDLSLYGKDIFGEVIKPKKLGPLAERYEFSPFSVLSARGGDWQERKRAWLALGIQSERGRDAEDFGIGDKKTWDRQKSSEKYEVNEHLSEKAQKALGCFAAYGNTTTERGNGSVTGTSVFDPVLTELAYKWFCPKGGQIVDPFAGGSVRGVVAGYCGFKYHGIDLRAEQVEANRAQLTEILPSSNVEWVVGDSMEMIDLAPDADFIFSCPPYGDLEVYSDDPKDLSNMEYHTFMAAYKRIILRCYQKLKNDRLACFVVGDFRDKKTGYYRGFVADTINAFREVGFHLYNDAILVTQAGSLPIMVSNTFRAGRKLGKTHQNILVFAKGNPRNAFVG